VTSEPANASPVQARDSLARWCGWLLIGLAGLSPVAAWLGPLAFAVLVAAVGLLALPALRIGDEDRPALIVLFAALIWAAVSTTWTPFHPKHPQDSTIVKLTAELLLYWAAVCAARRADPRLARRALTVFAWGFAALGVLLVAEAVSGGTVYRAVHDTVYEPIRPDLAGKNLGQSTFVLALLWPLAALGGRGALRWPLAAAMVAGVAAAGWRFGADAPLLALVLAPAVGLAVWRWPRGGPRVFAGLASAFFLTAPGLMWAVRRFGDLAEIRAALPASWAQRVGYWSHAIDWIGDKPLQGWGLDASRMFGPGIQLHPHDGALQVWLELGAVGTVAAAVFWGLALTRVARPHRDLPATATAASAAAYLLFGGANFGIWQEWWLGLGALVVMLAALHARVATAAELSTSTPSSE
jgi:O-antigen ligase